MLLFFKLFEIAFVLLNSDLCFVCNMPVERSSSPFNDRKTLPRAIVDIDYVHNPKSGKAWILNQLHYCSDCRIDLLSDLKYFVIHSSLPCLTVYLSIATNCCNQVLAGPF